MTAQTGAEPNRLQRRKARTRAALVSAAQSFIPSTGCRATPPDQAR